ncbi:unnamed protein product [Boreogadus saida]
MIEGENQMKGDAGKHGNTRGERDPHISQNMWMDLNVARWGERPADKQGLSSSRGSCDGKEIGAGSTEVSRFSRVPAEQVLGVALFTSPPLTS